MIKTLKVNEISNAFKVLKEAEATNGSKYKLVTTTVNKEDIHIGCMFSNKLGVDTAGKPIWSEFEGKLRVFLDAPLKAGKVTILGKKYDMVEKEITKEDGSTYTINLIQDAEGNEVGRYSKAYVEYNGVKKFYKNRWMVRFAIGE